MNKAKKNIVIVGFSKEERNSLGIPYLENQTIHYVDSISEAIKYQGYLLVIDNKVDNDIILLDKKYRKSFNKFHNIWMYNEKYNDYKHSYDKWSNIEKYGRDIFNDGYSAGEIWDKYKYDKEHSHIEIKLNKDKKERLEVLYNYLKSYKNIKTSQISKELNIDKRSIQRYMNDLNNIYHNIGYDYSNNEWYFIW